MSVPTTDSKMYQTMQRQPADIRRLLDEGWDQAGAGGRGSLAPARRVFVIGIGTSLHAAMVGAWLLRAAGADARAVSVLRLRPLPRLLSRSPPKTRSW